MKVLMLVVLASYCVTGRSYWLGVTPDTQSYESGRETKRSWTPGVYKGIKTGESTRQDVLRIFGRPMRVEFADDKNSDEVWFIYPTKDNFTGQLTVAIDKRSKRVHSISLKPENVAREVVIERFGKEFVLGKYAFCPGFEYAESAPIFESPQGSMTFIEYPSQGIAVLVNDMGEVYEIGYRKERVGFSSLRGCPKPLIKRGSTQTRRGK